MLTFSLIIEVAALLSAGVMVGNELAIAAIVHPNLNHLDDRTHTRAARALAGTLGRIMPFWYAATLLLSIVVLLTGRRPWGLAWWLTAVASLLFAISIGYTILRLVPINNSVMRWNPGKLPTDWRVQRERWDRRHRIRVWLLFAALIPLAISVAL